MGFLSKIGGAIKNVFKGILSVFSPILEPLGKALNSGLGKAIMIGLSIFTLGSAMIAGQAAFAATTAAQAAGTASGGFISAFVEGGKAFMSTLMGKGAESGISQTEAVTQGAQQAAAGVGEALKTGAVPGLGGTGGTMEGISQLGQAGAANVANAGKLVEGAGAAAEGANAGGLLSQAAAAGPAQVQAGPTKAAAQNLPPTGDKGWLERAKEMGKGFVDYAKTDSGGNVIGKLVEGAGNYYTEKDRQEFEDRIRRQWGKGTDDAGIRSMRDTEARVGRLQAPSAQDIAQTSQNTARTGGTRPQFSLPINQPAGG